MSAAALRQAVAEIIRESLGLPSSQCDLEDTARPSATSAAALYVAIHPGAWRSHRLDYGLDEEFGVNVTVSYRGTQYQPDKWGNKLLSVSSGIEAVARQIIPLLHCKPEVTQRANVILGGTSSLFINGEYLRLTGEQEPPADRQPGWWGAPVHKQDANSYLGMSLTMRFDGARRVQEIEEME
jgi:hypothetical protein